ncbi:tetratricopeptide repeat protein [candidate division KSB1 bacterium]|nr:tetratricopeptide repeat protein [candidate division KSB1 bacterium]
MKKLIAILSLAIIQSGYAGEKVNFFIPATKMLWGIKHFAVADFRQGDSVNTYIPQLVKTALKQHDFYHVVDSASVNAILTDTTYTRADLMGTDSIHAICRLLNVDAIIQGSVSEYEMLPDSSGEEEINREVWTGEYERDENDKIIEELVGGVSSRKKKFIQKLVKLPYLIHRAVVTVNFSIVDGETGLVVDSDSVTQRYDTGKIYGDEFREIPPPDEIIHGLCVDVVDFWITRISPNFKTVRRDIESGTDLLNAGKAYAESGFWDDAIKVWQSEIEESPNNPSAYYNLGLAYEALAEFKTAESYYKKAVLLKQERRYQKALDRLQEEWAERNRNLTEDHNRE